MSSPVVFYDVFEVHSTDPSTSGVYGNTVSKLNHAIPILTPSNVQPGPTLVVSRSGVDEWLAGIDENDPFRSEIDVRSSRILTADIETRPPLQELHSHGIQIGTQVGSQEGSQKTQSPPLKPRPLTSFVERARSLGRGKVPAREDRKAVDNEYQGPRHATDMARITPSATVGVAASPRVVSSTARTKRRTRSLAGSARTQKTDTTATRTRSQSWSQSLLSRMSRLVDKVPGSPTVDSNQCAVADAESHVDMDTGLDGTDTNQDVSSANAHRTTEPRQAIPDALRVGTSGSGDAASSHSHNCPTGVPTDDVRGSSDPDPSDSQPNNSNDSNDVDNCNDTNDTNDPSPTSPDSPVAARSQSHPSDTPASQSKALSS